MAIKPEDLDVETSIADEDIIMKTSNSNVTRTIKWSSLFSIIWQKIKDKIFSSEITLSAVDESKPHQPVDSIAVIHSAISELNVNNPAPVNSAAVNGALVEGYKETYETYRTVGKLKYSWEQDYDKMIKEVDVFFSGVTLTPSFSLVITNFRKFIQYGNIMDISAVCIGEDNNIICNGNCYINTQNENLLVSQNITSDGKFTVRVHCKYFI